MSEINDTDFFHPSNVTPDPLDAHGKVGSLWVFKPQNPVCHEHRGNQVAAIPLLRLCWKHQWRHQSGPALTPGPVPLGLIFT